MSESFEKKTDAELAPGSVDLDATPKNSSDMPEYSIKKEIANSTATSFGIRKAEVLASTYQNPFLIALLYTSVFACAYAYSLDGTIRYTFQTYATSSYGQHSLLATVNVIRSVVAAAAQPTYARLSDKFGRLELLLVAVLFYAVGTVIESQAYDVQRFAAGAVFYQIGYSGIILIVEVTMADFSTLNWRLFASFVPALPFIINTWVSGDVASQLLAAHSWNYCIGMWAYIFPLATVPLIGCFVHMRFMAVRTPEWKLIIDEEKEKKKSRNFFTDLFWSLDIVGILFIICVFGFILVPFTLAGGVKTTWQKGSTIAPLVIGFVLIPFFVYWEAKVARFPLFPVQLMKDRGVWSALIVAIFINWIWYMPNDYMYTVLIIGMRASVKAATRITSLYSFVSVLTGPLLGLVLVKMRRTKPFIIFGVSMWMISMGLLLHFRGDTDGIVSEKYINGVIGALCLMGFGAGFFTYVTQLSIQTCTNHEYMAVVLSLYLACYNIGSAIGYSISGAMWSQLMYKAIVKHMTALDVDTSLAVTAYGSPYTFIITYVWGTPERIAVVLAYADVQRKLCLAGLVLCVPLLFIVLFLRDHRLVSVQSLDEQHSHTDGLHGATEAIARTVVVNNYEDDDPIAAFFRKIFKKGDK